LVYDLYGRGYSDRPRTRQDAQFFHRQLRELLDHVGVGDDITLIGYSMGGAIATSFAAEHPGRIQQLVLLAPAGMRVPAGRMINIIRSSPLLGDWLMHA
ncbi:alpha/beta fold hydrolase, partial [Sulfitobacter sp. HI0129]